MNGLDDIVELLECDETLTVIRQGRRVDADVTYVDGLPVANAQAQKFDIICTVQPATGRDLQLLPEAFREKTTLILWQAHRTAAQDYVRMDVMDLVLFRNRAYQVQSAEDWESYSRCMLAAIDVGSYQGVIDPDNLPVLLPDAPKADTSEEELDVLSNPYDLYDVGILSMQQFFSAGDVYDFRVPGDPDRNSFSYRFPRAGVIFGFTITGRCSDPARIGAYVTQRVAATGISTDAFHLDPYSQPYFNRETGVRVTFDTPIAYAQDDVAQMKAHIGDYTQANLAVFLQVGLTKAQPPA